MLLAVDTSTQWMGLALYDGDQVLGESVWRTRSHHTMELAPAVRELLAHTQTRPEDLSVLASALGPGAFTSLRIGLAVVKGMALALRLPVVGIPTLDAVALSVTVEDLPLIATLQVGRGRIAAGHYQRKGDHWTPVGEIQLTTVEEMAHGLSEPTLISGELSPEERQMLARKRKMVRLATPAQALRRPAYLAELAWARYKAGRFDDPISLSPIYLRTAQPIPD